MKAYITDYCRNARLVKTGLLFPKIRPIYDHAALKWCSMRKTGVSLIEILIAISIFVVSGLGIFLVFHRGGIEQKTFTSERFTAMFLAQKVIEDINLQNQENPYYFTELSRMASTMEPEQIVDGESIFFRLLDGPEGSTELIPDQSSLITRDSDLAYDQLKRFKLRVLCEFVPDALRPGESFDNLLQIIVEVTWDDPENAVSSYSISYLIHGENKDRLASGFESAIKEIPESLAATIILNILNEAYSGAPGMAQVLSANNGGDPVLMKALGSMLTISDSIQTATKLCEVELEKLKKQMVEFQPGISSSDAVRNCSLQEEVAGLQEQLSVQILQMIRMLQPQSAAMKNLTIDAAALGQGISEPANLKKIAEALYETSDSLKGISSDLQMAENAWVSLLSPPMIQYLPERRRNSVVRRWIELRKGIILFLDFDADKISIDPMLKDSNKFISKYRDSIKGHFPAFEKYLDTEMRVCANSQSLRKAYASFAAEMKKITEVINSVDQFTDAIMNLLSEEDKQEVISNIKAKQTCE